MGYYTMVRKEFVRIVRIWSQTLLPPVITTSLYFAIFGTFIGSQVAAINGHSYIQFIVPGLVMLSVVTNSYTNVATTFFQGKFFSRNIDEILVSPTPAWVLIAGYVGGGMVRGGIVGILVLLVSVLFAVPTISHLSVVFLFLVLASMIFALGGLVNGIYAKSFDGITIVPTFVLTPLVYLGGVFYSVNALSPVFRSFTLVNPIFYIVNGFRWGFLGISDVSVTLCVGVLVALAVALIATAWYMIRIGLGLKQ